MNTFWTLVGDLIVAIVVGCTVHPLAGLACFFVGLIPCLVIGSIFDFVGGQVRYVQDRSDWRASRAPVTSDTYNVTVNNLTVAARKRERRRVNRIAPNDSEKPQGGF